MTDIEALRARMREAAEKATPGPWKVHLVDDTTVIADDGREICTTCDSSQTEREDGYNIEYERMEADAAFIALASPANVKALDAEITRLREDLDRVTRERDEALKAVASGAYDAALKEHQNVYTHTVALCVERMRDAQARAEAAEAALAKRDEEVARLREAFSLADSIASEAMRWGFYASDEAIAVLVKARTLSKDPANAE